MALFSGFTNLFSGKQTSWRDTQKDVLEEMWVAHKKIFCVGVCMICPKCGGSSASFCECAKQRYFNSLTEKDVEDFLAEREKDYEMESANWRARYAKELEEMWEDQNQYRTHRKDICGTCHTGSPSVCVCAKRRFFDLLSYVHLKGYLISKKERHKNAKKEDKPEDKKDDKKNDFEEHQRVLEELWENEKKHSFGVCMICPTCGGSSASFCECAKQRFFHKHSQRE
jgi:hypothetical protein